MKFSDSLSLFEYLLKEHPNNLMEGLDGIKNISNDMLNETKQLILAHNKNLQQTQFHQSISHSTELLNENKKIESLIGKHISHFTLEALIGSGGMGVVYLARRNDGKFEQKVAIKIVYPTITVLHGPQNLTREAQYLAKLNHPNIAGVLDAGECEFGMYMVMEYIEGTTFLSYCQEQNLNTKQRLLLFCKVCDAVSYAHQNRVIHADLKPSNILVNKQGEPKLVDFGVARTINNEQTDFVVNEYIKALSQEYASPEQLAGQALTTQSDVYSLGKVLKNLVQKPSYEIKCITNKALNDVTERYESSSQLKVELECVLNNKPISILQSKHYVLKKYSQRHPIPVMLASALIIASISFTSVLWAQNTSLMKEQQLSQSILEFMFNTFEQANPEVNKGQPILAKDLLLKQQQKTHTEFNNNPEIIYRLNKKIGDSLTALGEYQSANNAYQQALNIKLEENENDFWLASEIAENLIQLSQFEQAKHHLQEPLTHDNQKQARYYQLLGRIYAGLENYKKANELYTKSLGFNPDKKLESLILTDQAINLVHLSNYPKSLELREKALSIITEYFPEDDVSIALAEHEIAIIFHNMGKYEEALKYFDSSLAKSIKIYSKNHPLIAEQLANLANTYAELKETEKAILTLKEVTQTLENFYPSAHTDTGFSYVYLGNAQLDAKDYKAAKRNFEQALAIDAQLNQSDSHLKLGALNGLALVYRFTEQYSKAKQAFADLLNLVTNEYGMDHPRRGIVLVNSIPVEVALNNKQKAKENGQEAIKIFAKQYGEDSQFIEMVQKRIKDL
ncbi:serine/threonine-protein kinase [Pseudoalteromonas sp. SG44-8]|uniref:serine/threonine-protein kinase n=1 Tax=Pseudoalteromonas sp. SG44-8 TaxID=2760958 RepID=UPI0015FF2CDF|nr:serine/threonine-protein kinase [Pseudoalteromonas sp. SG44-8]MBB1399065.1 protein kinase [Pseudoalteromonas sp. SG44-8]